MAAPPALRNSIGELSRLADRDLSALWSRISEPAAATSALMDAIPPLVVTYGTAAATLAATWYDDHRERAAVTRAFAAIPVEPSARGAEALVGWATSTATSADTLRVLVNGGVQKRIADNARETVKLSSAADPAARGWTRAGSGECEFCESLLTGVVHAEASADFPAHDHCRCYAVPAFRR